MSRDDPDRGPAALEAAAAYFARGDAAGQDARLDDSIRASIARCALADAIFWQRVKLRAHLLRAMAEGCRTETPTTMETDDVHRY